MPSWLDWVDWHGVFLVWFAIAVWLCLAHGIRTIARYVFHEEMEKLRRASDEGKPG